ncbi:MAG: tRNA (adenosine(37)-N6)-dimethylallyltransferase MiaA [Candidatus Tectomicrobia bacterium]|nr:tRNA (adenosine(37)-N6)-dimethylallyltransferase MiaA [Candidatus Tectomicrobia bacterium]
MGPTAVGKTTLALRVASALKAEIVSVDSMQIYKLIDIGTAKPTVEEQRLVKHHMIDLVFPDERYSAAEYGVNARGVIESLYRQGICPLVVGGSGLYLRSLIEGIFEGPRADQCLREQLRHETELHGNETLYARLQEVDPQAAQKIHLNDRIRLIRALEVYLLTGQPISSLQRLSPSFQLYSPFIVGLYRNRDELSRKIEERVDAMISAGLVEEVRALKERGYTEDLTSMQALGYKEMLGYLNGRYDLATAISLQKRETKRFAKRQMTWFRKVKGIHWINLSLVSEEESVAQILDYFQGQKSSDE